jgi:hypothetical protein
MARIRLLTSVVGDGPVQGDVGDELDVDAATARVWADGERAERVTTSRSPETPEGRGAQRRTAATVTRPAGG